MKRQETYIQLNKKDLRIFAAILLLSVAAIGYYLGSIQSGNPAPNLGTQSFEVEAVQESAPVIGEIQENQPEIPKTAEPQEAQPRQVDAGAPPSSASCGGNCGSPTCGAKTGGSCGCGG
ncbi:MAG: hypothetical protein ABH950_09380 [Candidatus Altiarchaeota archaeon]